MFAPEQGCGFWVVFAGAVDESCFVPGFDTKRFRTVDVDVSEYIRRIFWDTSRGPQLPSILV